MGLLGLHLCVGFVASLQVANRERSLGALWLPLVFLGFHVAYGFGTLWGFVHNAKLLASLPGRLITAKG